MLLAFLILGGAFIAGSIVSNVNWDVFSVVIIAAAGIALWALGLHEGVDYVAWIFNLTNLINVAIGVVAWFVVGAVWAIFKWWAYLHDPETQTFIKSQHDDWAALREKNPALVDENFLKTTYANSFRPSQNKARIMRWIIWWPTSVVWSATYKFVTRIAIWVYDWIVQLLLKITHSQVDRAIKRTNID